MRVFVIAAAVVMYILVTFFGLGPVLLADGSTSERLTTLLGVVAAYALITWLLKWALRRQRPHRS